MRLQIGNALLCITSHRFHYKAEFGKLHVFLIVGSDELLAAIDKQRGEIENPQRVARIVQRAANQADERGNGRDKGGMVDPRSDRKLRFDRIRRAHLEIAGKTLIDSLLARRERRQRGAEGGERVHDSFLRFDAPLEVLQYLLVIAGDGYAEERAEREVADCLR